jgi:hypothetical protein
MPVMHTCTHSTTLQVGPHLATTYFFKVAKATDTCSTLRIHNQCEAAPQWSLLEAIQFFFFKMAHNKVFGTHCNCTSPDEQQQQPMNFVLLDLECKLSN